MTAATARPSCPTIRPRHGAARPPVPHARLAAGHAEPLIEVCAGLLDADDPETCIRKEAEEELGVRLGDTQRVFDAL